MSAEGCEVLHPAQVMMEVPAVRGDLRELGENAGAKTAVSTSASASACEKKRMGAKFKLPNLKRLHPCIDTTQVSIKQVSN